MPYCDVGVRGPEPPRLTGANIGKAITRAFTPPGTGGVQAAAQAAQNKPAPTPIQPPGLPAGQLGNGVNTTDVPGYAPWIGINNVQSPDVVQYAPTPGADYSAAPEPTYADINPDTLAAADAYVQRGLSNDTGFGVDPNVEWAIQNQDNQFRQQQADMSGPAWQATTLGQQGQAFRDVADASQRFQARQAALTTGVNVQNALRGQAAQRLGLAQQANAQDVQQRQYNATNAATQAMFGAGLDVQQLENNAQFQAQQNAQNAALLASQRNTDTAGRFGIQMQGNQLQQGNQQYAANSIASGVSGVGGIVGGLLGGAMSFMSDAREKEDIVPMFKHKGVMFYTYSEKDDPEHRMRIGPMAQEIAQKRPDAVHEDDRGVLHIGANALRHMLT